MWSTLRWRDESGVRSAESGVGFAATCRNEDELADRHEMLTPAFSGGRAERGRELEIKMAD